MKKLLYILVGFIIFCIIIGIIGNNTSNDSSVESSDNNTTTANREPVNNIESNLIVNESVTTNIESSVESVDNNTTTANREPANKQEINLIANGIWTDTISWKIDSNGTMFVIGTGAIPDYEKGTRNQPWIKYQKSVTALVVERGITRIGDRAFQSFRYLERAVIDEGVTSIGEWAFQNCYELKDVELIHSIKLETGAFRSTPVEWKIHGAPSNAYANSQYYTAWRNVQLTGNYRNDIINIALSQVGYKEGNSENELAGSVSGSGDYTEYGRSLDTLGSAWCSEFAIWCIRNAGVPTSIIANGRAANVTSYTANTSADFYTWDATTFGGGKYLPQKGDLVLWSWDGKMHSIEENLSHTSILWDITPLENGKVLLKTIDGNSNNEVRVREYTVSVVTGQLVSKTGLVCYIIAPHYNDCSLSKR